VILRYRICYQKNNELIFISHLDLQQTFQRAFRRAKFKLIFSEGFNPHPKLTFSPPLTLFVSSAEEYLDVQMESDVSEEELKKRLQGVLPPSLLVNHIRRLTDQDQALSELIGMGDYTIILELEGMPDNIGIALTELLNAPVISVKKRNKQKKIVEKDIKSGIYAFTYQKTGNLLTIECVLSLVNNTLLNPTTVAAALFENIPQLAGAKVTAIRKNRIFPPEK